MTLIFYDDFSHFLVDNFIFPLRLLWLEVCKTTLLFFLTEVYYVQIHLLYTRCDVVIKKIFIRENMILIIHEHYMFMINQVKQVSCFYIMGCFRMHNTPSFYFLLQWISVLVFITKSKICCSRVIITISITIFTNWLFRIHDQWHANFQLLVCNLKRCIRLT